MKGFKSSRSCLLMLLAASLMFALTACGGGGGGGGGGGKKAGLPDGTFIKTVELGADSWYNGPFNMSTRRYQGLMNSADIDGSGYITAISMRYESDELTDSTCPNYTLSLGHTSVDTLGTNMAANFDNGRGGIQTVIDGKDITIPAGSAGDYFIIKFDTPFYYNGVDNLLIEFINPTGCSTAVAVRTAGSAVGYDGVAYNTNLSDTAVSWSTDVFNMKFHFKGGVDQITQDGTGTTWFYPFTTSSINQKVQMLYQADEINGTGPITGMALKVGQTTSNVIFTMDIKVGHTALGNLVAGSDFADNFSGKPVTVASGAIWNVPTGVPAGEYIWLPFPDGVFKYNGTDNLLIEYNITSASGSFTPASISSLPTNRRLYGPSGGTTSTGEAAALYIARFRFKGGTMDVIESGAYSSGTQWFQTADSQVISVFAASELGTRGTITKIALRAAADTVDGSYPARTIRMGYKDDLEFNTSDNYLDQMTNTKTVFSGPLTIAAGSKAGDWIEIPLSSAFSYDPTKNLVIYYDMTGGTATNIMRTTTAVRFPNRVAGDNSDNSSADTIPDWTDDHVPHIRMWLK